jgi:hypothetical protein
LHRLEALMEQGGLLYARHRDDLLVSTPTRHKLRQAVRVLKQHC